MKTQAAIGINELDFHILPVVYFMASAPSILNMRHKIRFREINIGFKWMVFYAIIQINF
jgi:hypothetical protein